MASTLCFGCVSGSIRRVEVSNELPTDLSKEIQVKFEVRDHLETSSQNLSRNPSGLLSSGPEVRSVETAVEKNGKAKKRASKKRGQKSEMGKAPIQDTQPVATAPFVYLKRRPAKDPIWVGEKLVFSISYFGIAAGDFTLEVMPYKTVGLRKAYHVKGNAISSSVFSLFYRLNDVVESYFDFEGTFSHRFHVVMDETKQSRDALELNDSEKQQTYYWNRWHPKDGQFTETKQFGPIQPFSQDSLSALYFLRTMPLTDGSVVTMPVVSEGKTWEAVCSVLRREMRDTPMGRVQTIVIQPDAKYQGILKKNGDSFLWVTDDARHLPVRLEAKVKIGTVVANLKKMEPGIDPESLPSGAMPSSTPIPASP